jgi:hypothetical protein
MSALRAGDQHSGRARLGPYTGAGVSPQVHAPVSINVSALDSQSVSRLLRAINDAVKSLVILTPRW